MDIYLVTPVGPFPTAVGNAFGTFTTRADVSPEPKPVIQGGTLRLGSKIKVECEGEFSTTGTPTLSIGIFIGTVAAPSSITTVLAENTAVATGTTAAAWPWRLEWRGIVTGTLGTAASVVGMGNLEMGTALTTSNTIQIPATLALRTIAWDTTIAKAIGVCAAWGASSASNTIKVYNHSVLLFN